MESSDNDEDGAVSSDISKRKLNQFEDSTATSFKKARFSWQVKGGKGKQNASSSEGSQNSTETAPTEASCSTAIGRIRQQSNCDNEKLFHEMEFDTPSSSSQRNMISLNHAIPKFPHETEGDNMDSVDSDCGSKLFSENSLEPQSGSECVTSPSRIKQVQTSLHACLLTTQPSSSSVINATIPLENPLTIPTIPRRLSAPSIGQNLSDSISLDNDSRDGIEFRDALRSMHRSNLSAYEKWQKRNTAGAIVDNVFNRTLEEMGISPDAAANHRSLERSAVENQSILAAINSQGLTANRNVDVEYTEPRSEVVTNEFDYLRQNRDVFDRTFERLGYFRYDIIHQRNPDTHSPENDTDIAGRQLEETGTQTDDNFISVPPRSSDVSCSDSASPEKFDSNSESTSFLNKSRTDGSDISVGTSEQFDNENEVVLSEKPSFSSSSCQRNTISKDDTKDIDIKEDTAVNEDVLSLAVSAAIHSQGLTIK